jgi:hypothetical protein
MIITKIHKKLNNFNFRELGLVKKLKNFILLKYFKKKNEL